jgi:hypothetical protein
MHGETERYALSDIFGRSSFIVSIAIFTNERHTQHSFFSSYFVNRSFTDKRHIQRCFLSFTRRYFFMSRYLYRSHASGAAFSG